MTVRRVVASASAPPPRGFPKWAWWTVFLATFMFAVPLASPWWSKVLRREIPGTAEEEGEGPTAASNLGTSPAPAEPLGSTLKVVLHTRLADQAGLGTIEREVPYVRGIIPQIQAAVRELGVATADVPALLPAGTRVLDVAYSPGGTVYIDFSPELDAGRGVGAEEEKTLVQGIVTTIAENFAAVRRVVILVDGKAPRSGHLDLTRPLRLDDPIFTVDEEPLSAVVPPKGASSAAPPGPGAKAKATPANR